MNDRRPRGVTVALSGAGGERFAGAGILRYRPHPAGGEPLLQLGVPDDLLDFRPTGSGRYQIEIEDGGDRRYTAQGAWLERIGTTWWFILQDG